MSEQTITVASTTDVDDNEKAEYEADIAEHFIQRGNQYVYSETQVEAFSISDDGKTISTDYDNEDIASAVVKLAASKGWTTWKASGNDHFYKNVERASNAILEKHENELSGSQASERIESEELTRRNELARRVSQGYEVDGKKYMFKSNNGRKPVEAFRDHGGSLSTPHNDETIAANLIKLATAKGWSDVKVSGHKSFRRMAWTEARNNGLEVTGYTPTPQELSLHQKPEHNIVERDTQAERDKASVINAVTAAIVDKQISDPESAKQIKEVLSMRVNSHRGPLPAVRTTQGETLTSDQVTVDAIQRHHEIAQELHNQQPKAQELSQ